MSITSRRAQLDAYRTSEDQITALFAEMTDRITGILTSEAGQDGAIPLQRSQAVRDGIRAVVEGYFVQLQMLDLANEQRHLETLIDTARAELRNASQRRAERIRARLARLVGRYEALRVRGVALKAFDANGQPLTPYARIVYDRTRDVVSAAAGEHNAMMRDVLSEAPAVLRWLESAQ